MLAAVLFLALAVSGSVRSQSQAPNSFLFFENGNELLDSCNNDPPWCLGYVVGIADAMSGAQSVGGTVNGWRACLPYGVTEGQVMDVVVQALRAHPQRRHNGASGLVASALSEAFPCR
jgi:hypothetical protein